MRRLQQRGRRDAGRGGCQQLHRRPFEDRRAAAKASEIQRAAAQPHHTDGGQQQTVQFQRTGRGGQSDDQHHARRSQHQTQPLQRTQPLAQQRPGQQSGQQWIERLHQRNLRCSDMDHGIVRGQQQHGVGEHTRHCQVPPSPAQRAPRSPQRQRHRQQCRGGDDHPHRHEQQRRQMPQPYPGGYERGTPQQDEGERRYPNQHGPHPVGGWMAASALRRGVAPHARRREIERCPSLGARRQRMLAPRQRRGGVIAVV